MGSAEPSASITVIWEPQPGPQTQLLRCPVFEIFFGGARGGGKTDGMLGDWIAHASKYGEHAIGLMVRRERTQLIETIERSRQIFGPLGAQYHEQDKLWRFPNGARLRFAYLERDSDADAYQGHSYTRVYVEEIGTFPNPAPILKLMATLRSGAGVPVGFRATGNPGGPGHNWVKARYIDPHPRGWKVQRYKYRNPFNGNEIERDRVYIPSRLSDNRYLGDEYVANLQMVGNEELVRAWLEGDWNVTQGAFFSEFSIDRHVIRPFEIPNDWLRFRSLDWGSAKPFSAGWWAVSDGSDVNGRVYPRGSLIRYREWYGMEVGRPNVGLKMVAEKVAEGIQQKSLNETYAYSVADPAIFSEDGGPSIAERMSPYVQFRRADNARVSRAGAMGGWDQLRARLVGEDDKPTIYFFSTCTEAIRTLPALQHDPDRPEDVDTAGEDHAPDEIRYACMSRPYVKQVTNPADARYPVQRTFNEIRDAVARRRKGPYD